MAKKGDIIELSVSVILTEDLPGDEEAMGFAARSLHMALEDNAGGGFGFGFLIKSGTAKRLATSICVRDGSRMAGSRHKRRGQRRGHAA